MRNIILQYWRVIACICIVYHHTIYLFDGVWPPLGSELCSIPGWAYFYGEQAKRIGLDSFTFISGAVLYYTSVKIPFHKFILKKFVRIIVPCIFYALAYKALFPNLMFDSFPDAVNGTHLWYLPMIFCCAVIVSTHFFSKYAFPIIAVFYCSLFFLQGYCPFRTFIELYHFFPLFYLGYISNLVANNPQKFLDMLYIPCKWERIAVLLTLCTLLLLKYSKLISYTHFIPNISVAIVLSVIYVFIFTNLKTHLKSQRTNIQYVMWGVISRNCFAIYLLHQFCLNFWGVYAKEWIGSHSFYITLPVVFLSTFIGSLILSEGYGQIKAGLMIIIQNNKSLNNE